MAWKLHAIEQTQLRRKYRVDGVGRPKFDFHIGAQARGPHAPRAVLARARLRLLLRDDVPAHAEGLSGLRRGGAADELILIVNF